MLLTFSIALVRFSALSRCESAQHLIVPSAVAAAVAIAVANSRAAAAAGARSEVLGQVLRLQELWLAALEVSHGLTAARLFAVHGLGANALWLCVLAHFARSCVLGTLHARSSCALCTGLALVVMATVASFAG